MWRLCKVWTVMCLLATLLATPALAYEVHDGPTGVMKNVAGKTFDGYTLFAPTVKSTVTYLINMQGDVVHSWNSKYPPGLYAVLLPNGNLLRGASLNAEQPVKIGGAGGMVEEIDWNGNVVWSYRMISPDEVQHHCFDRMPNGNTLILGWERKTPEQLVAKGRKPGTWQEVDIKGQKVKDFWIDFVREVDKNGKTVWEWHAWDHIGTGPDQLDINYRLPTPVGAGYDSFDWSHFNTVEYLPKTNQVLLNSRNLSEIYIVDKKSGKLTKRWGNPSASGQGDKPSWYNDGSQQIFGSHSASMLPNGNIQIFDNGSERPEGNRSRVVEVDLKSGKIVWQYASKMPNSFFSYRQGAAQRLPNNNVLVTSTHNGHVFEITQQGEVVWEFVNPISFGKPVPTLSDAEAGKGMDYYSYGNMIHRAYRYGKDYKGLKGRDLSVKGPLVPGYPKFLDVWKPVSTK